MELSIVTRPWVNPMSQEDYLSSCGCGARACSFFIDTDDVGAITRASPELCALLDVDEGDLLGHRVSELVHPDDRVDVERVQLLAVGAHQLRVRLTRRGGTDVWLAALVSAQHGTTSSSHWAFLDVSGQVRLERRLVELATSWTDIFNTLEEGVVLIDRDGTTLAANVAAAEFLGVSLEALPGSLARAQVVVVDEHGVPMPRERLPSTRALRTGEIQEEPVAYRRQDGTIRWLQAKAIPLTRPAAAEPDRVVILLEDALGPSKVRPGGPVRQAAQSVLTPRELDVLRLLANGLDVRGAAASLGISVHTARGHVKQLMQKLDARSQLQAVVFAARMGLIRIE